MTFLNWVVISHVFISIHLRNGIIMTMVLIWGAIIKKMPPLENSCVGKSVNGK